MNFPLSSPIGNAIAQAGGDACGFVKVVWQHGKIAGIAALGHGVSHLVTVAYTCTGTVIVLCESIHRKDD